MDGEFFSDLYCEECDTVHFCGEYSKPTVLRLWTLTKPAAA